MRLIRQQPHKIPLRIRRLNTHHFLKIAWLKLVKRFAFLSNFESKKIASCLTGYFFAITTNQSHQRPYTDVTPQAP